METFADPGDLRYVAGHAGVIERADAGDPERAEPLLLVADHAGHVRRCAPRLPFDE